MMFRPYKIWCAFDTETTNVTLSNGAHAAYPILYIFNDVHQLDVSSYMVDDPREVVSFFRHESDAIAYLKSVMYDAALLDVVPVVCAYNLMFDLQTILYTLHDDFELRASAQSSTNVYTLDLMLRGQCVMRFWDTYHLEPGGLKAMGVACGVDKLMGDWDYSLIRTPETPLSELELGYAKRDVQVIPAYLKYLCDAYSWLTSDMLGFRVITKTSLVRQMAKHEIGPLSVKTGKGKRLTLYQSFNRLCVAELPNGYDSYALRLACFRGGLTFTSAKTASVVVRHVLSIDETSAHHFLINGRRVPVGFVELTHENLIMWLDDVRSYTLDDVLYRYHYPFQRWFHVRVRLENVRLKQDSAFGEWGIGLLAQAKFKRTIARRVDDDENERDIASMEDVRARGYVDSVGNGTFAFGKLTSCDVCEVHLTELEWWLVCQVYDFDAYDPIVGEGTIKSIWPPDYVALQSNVLYGQKNDAKRIYEGYDETPYLDDVPAWVPDPIRESLRGALVSTYYVRDWYGKQIKGSFNGIYGTEAQNVFKADFAFDDGAEMYVDRDTVASPDNFGDKLDEQDKCMVLYTYGMRIVGGSRMQLVIAMMLLWAAFGHRVTCCGGDTDSIKVRCDSDVTSQMILDALEPLHVATKRAIDASMARLRRTFPALASPLTHLGCFEIEPISKGSNNVFYSWHMEAWNKARISVDERLGVHVTCAGLSRPHGAYTIETWVHDMLLDGWDPSELLPLALGYNVTITNEVCHALEHARPLYSELFDDDVTDYRGHKSHVHTHGAVALFDAARKLGDTLKNVNIGNVEYLREVYGREVETTDRVITCVYNLPFALALMMLGERVTLNMCRLFTETFVRPVLYMQSPWGLEVAEHGKH